MTSQQSGRTLIEILAIMGIIGVISVSGFQLYAKAMNSIKVNHLMEKVYLLANQIRNEEIENADGRKTFDLPDAAKTLAYGYSYNSSDSGYASNEITVVINGPFTFKICRIIQNKITTKEYAGLKNIKANAISLETGDCPTDEISSMTFVIDSTFKETAL